MLHRLPGRGITAGTFVVQLHNRSVFKPFVLLALVCFALAASAPRDAHAVVVQIDTASLSGAAARFEFALLDGDGTPANNFATISGNTIQDFGTPFHKDLTLGSSAAFDVSFTLNFAPSFPGATPDLLVLSLLDPATNFTLVDTDLDALAAPVPYQDALLVIDLSTGKFLTPAASTPAINVIVPEPATVGLLAALGLLLIGRNLLSTRRSSPRA
jgi:hypothetical protein